MQIDAILIPVGRYGASIGWDIHLVDAHRNNEVLFILHGKEAKKHIKDLVKGGLLDESDCNSHSETPLRVTPFSGQGV